MVQKLTLSLSKTVIENAKITAKNKQTSLSKLVEKYLINLNKENNSFSLTELILSNAPKKKTKNGTEKAIIKKAILRKYGN